MLAFGCRNSRTTFKEHSVTHPLVDSTKIMTLCHTQWLLRSVYGEGLIFCNFVGNELQTGRSIRLFEGHQKETEQQHDHVQYSLMSTQQDAHHYLDNILENSRYNASCTISWGCNDTTTTSIYFVHGNGVTWEEIDPRKKGLALRHSSNMHDDQWSWIQTNW